MEPLEVSHNEIFERLVKVESKVDQLSEGTGDLIKAFNDAQGAFHVLEWIAKVAKPILWTVGAVAAVVALLQDYRQH